MKYIYIFGFFFLACSNTSDSFQLSVPEIEDQLKGLNAIIVDAALKKDVTKRLSVFNPNPICMADHQASMQGLANLKIYHQSIFERQKLSQYLRTTVKVYPLKERIIEVGTFVKSGIMEQDSSSFLHEGKYLNLWTITADGELQLAVETWNYDKGVEDINSILVNVPAAENHGLFEIESPLTPEQHEGLSKTKEIMSRGVNERDGALRATIYHDDGIFMPHDAPLMLGKEQILEHLLEYNSGNVSIDSLEAGSNWAENLDDFIVESSFYYVEWSVDEYSGIGKGKGLRLWKKTEEGGQKILVNIALRDTDLAQ